MTDALIRIDAEIGRLETQIASLRYARTFLERDAPAVPWPEPADVDRPAKKSPPPVAPQRPEASEPRTQADSHGYAKAQQIRRHRMARLLDEHGPMQFGQIAGLVRCAPATLRKDLDESGLFEKSDPTSTRPLWRLTESGRKLAASNEPG